MEKLIEVALPSGAKLAFNVAPFAEAKALYQAGLEEMKSLSLNDHAQVDANFWKDIFCVGLSSKKIEAALNVCLGRATYNGHKITNDTWEPIAAREDYMVVCFEVAKENILPFTKSLYAKYSHILEALKLGQA